MRMSLHKLLPFLRWFPLSREGLRGDFAAGVTVALVLIPQSMAYAQLAGLPVVYGLYASFVPVIVASLWGSLSQLHTGPVAMLSLMSAGHPHPLRNARQQRLHRAVHHVGPDGRYPAARPRTFPLGGGR